MSARYTFDFISTIYFNPLSLQKCLQDIRIFARNNQFVTIPTSPPGSIFPGSCSCSTAGGFEGGASTGPVGCTPCEDGFYSEPGMPSCQQCPAGTYASQLTGQRDFYRCPSATSPAIQFSPAYQWKGQAAAEAEVTADECTQLVVGAHACTSCPLEKPFTRSTGSTSGEDCRACPAGMYFDGGLMLCAACRAACNATLDEYETHPCAHDQNRDCGYCDSSTCDPVSEYVLEEGCSNGNSRACGSCTEKPENSQFVLGMAPCSWSCDSGYFSDIFSRTCEACTQFDALSCPAGRVFSRCSDFLHRDASCDIECSAEEHGMPVENSEWVLTTFDENYAVAAAVGYGTKLPNVGCMWQCVEGYRLEKLAEGQLNICVRV